MNTDEWDLLLKALALLGAATAFFVGLWQYVRAQRWRRAEWVAREVSAFIQDPAVRSALHMIDWGDRSVRLFTAESREDGELVRVTDDMVAKALQHHGQRPDGFSVHEAAIRDAFDRFLDGLERLEAFLQAGLISGSDVRPHVAYWIHHIRSAQSGDGTVERLVQLRAYIEAYGYVGVQSLFGRFKRQSLLPMPPSDWARP